MPGAARLPHQRGPLLPRNHQPGHPGAAAEGPARRTGVHDPHQGGHAGHPLPDARPVLPDAGRMLLRAHQCPDDPDRGPQRRHAHHPRYQRVPFAGGERRPEHEGVRPALPPRRGPHQQPRYPGGAGRAPAGVLHRHPRHPGRHRQVQLKAPNAIERSQGKSVRVIDKRKLQ